MGQRDLQIVNYSETLKWRIAPVQGLASNLYMKISPPSEGTYLLDIHSVILQLLQQKHSWTASCFTN